MYCVCVRMWFDTCKDGKFVRASVSVDHPMYPPRPDAVRAEVSTKI